MGSTSVSTELRFSGALAWVRFWHDAEQASLRPNVRSLG